jgi:putative DNA methylase
MLKSYEWQDKPALIEHLFPVQKISAESFKEQMAGSGKTLTALGSYWKGRKPLILNKACILGALLPATDDPLKDLEVFELLMGMDKASLEGRLEHKNDKASRFFLAQEQEVDSHAPYNDWVRAASRPEECSYDLFNHSWAKVNAHLGTTAFSFPELVEQIGIARFGHRPRVADVFSGSGQIPFEAARLGCDVYASDLNPIACLLTWGGFNIVGASPEKRIEIENAQKQLAEKVQAEIDALEIETDGKGWRAKVFLYCLEIVCPESGWKVPLLPSLIINKTYKIVARLIPVPAEKRYDIEVVYVDSEQEVEAAKIGTVKQGDVVHSPDGVIVYRVSINAIRGDYKDGKDNKNRLRLWEKSDFIPRPDDIYQERLYCVQWMKKKPKGSQFNYSFRSVTADDLKREQTVIDFVAANLADWQEKGFIPDMVIEAGTKTDEPIRTRGWTYWHHLFNARQLQMMGIINKYVLQVPEFTVMMPAMLNLQSKLCAWHNDGSKGGLQNAFSNQALNTLWNYGSRGLLDIVHYVYKNSKNYPLQGNLNVNSHPAQALATENDIYITDPPYGDAVKYEEITEFFIAWLRKNPPAEFAHWNWDSRRSLAIKGEGEDFRQGMIAAYRNMADKMPDNGIQVLMFTHQSGSIWGDMASIIWASGLQVTAAWYVVTETDSALRQGANVTGTIMLVLRKRQQSLATFRSDLGWEIEEAVQTQIESLLRLDVSVKAQGSEGLYNDADLQMAGYAAALKVLTAYATIDGKNMVIEAEAPQVKGKKTFVDELIDFAVLTAVQFLVPVGFEKDEWKKLTAVERFYLKMAEMEHQGSKTLDNYQNFAKAFKVHHFDQLLSDSSKANSARLKLAIEFKSSMMSGDAELASTPLRALLYAFYELDKEIEVDDVLLHLMENCPNYNQNKALLAKMAQYLAEKRGSLKATKTFHPDKEASAARVMAEAIRSQRL